MTDYYACGYDDYNAGIHNRVLPDRLGITAEDDYEQGYRDAKEAEAEETERLLEAVSAGLEDLSDEED